MLRGQDYLAVPGERFCQRAHTRFAADHERRHHEREDDHVPNRHHGQVACLEFFLGLGHWVSVFVSYPAFSRLAMEISRFSTISFVTSKSFTRFWLGKCYISSSISSSSIMRSPRAPTFRFNV